MTAVPDVGACCSTCAATVQGAVLPTICSLETKDFADRIAHIRNLAGDALLRSRRAPLRLELTYRPDYLAEVSDLVAKEAGCCGFLVFDLQSDARGVYLAITAPPEAAETANELFDHFAHTDGPTVMA